MSDYVDCVFFRSEKKAAANLVCIAQSSRHTDTGDLGLENVGRIKRLYKKIKILKTLKNQGYSYKGKQWLTVCLFKSSQSH